MTLSDFRTQLEPLLQETFRSYAQALPPIESAFLQELLNYPSALLQGGKRIRPYLASIAFTNLGGTLTTEILRVLSSLEFFHLFCLIHDDIIDEGALRHGIPTLHTYAKTRLEQEKRLGQAAHLGEAHALLIGDLLFAWSIDLMQSPTVGTPRSRERVRTLFFQMINEVVIGQLLDVDLTTRSRASSAEIAQKMYLKTAGYTFVKPLQLGASLCTSAKPVMRFCERFGTAVGHAFQWQDDLLDLTGDPTKTKKTCFSDLLTRQQTPFTQHVREQGSKEDVLLLDALLGHPLTEAEQQEARNLFERTGAFSVGQRGIETALANAETLLAKATFLKHPEEFHDLIALLHHRTS